MGRQCPVCMLLCLALATLVVPAWAAVERYAVLIGNNRGGSDEPALRYAEADAERMYELLRDVSGFRVEDMVLAKGEEAPAIERILINVNARVRSGVARPGTDVLLFVYYSGHADASALHLGKTTLDLTLIEQLVGSSAASFRVLVVDACRSGAITRVKGGRPGPPFLEMTDRLDSQGAVFLTSSSMNEDAQESDELRGSFFSHYFRSALLGAGDDDRDGRVTLEEAYRYAYQFTLNATSRTWAGSQHPTYRYQLHGQGRIVLSEPGARRPTRATLVFAEGRDYLVMRENADGVVVGEVGSGSRARTLSVAPGRYFVRARAPDHLLEGKVDVGASQTVAVDDRDLRRFEYARLVRKGIGPAETAHVVEAGHFMHTPLSNAATFCQGAFAGYSAVFSALTLGARLTACQSAFANETLDATVTELGLELRGAYVYDLPVVSFEIGASVGGAFLMQRFSTVGRAPSRESGAAELGLGAAAAIDLYRNLGLFIEEQAQTYLYSQQRSPTAERSFAPSFAWRQMGGVRATW
jgi:hypothetical protein